MTRSVKCASDGDIESASGDIVDILRSFDRPKDAGSALALAHFAIIKASFEPEERKEALDLVETHCKLMTEFINEGWQ